MQKINTIIGIVIIALLSVALTVALIDNFTDAFGKETYIVSGTFSNVGGLTINSPVQISGVIIGHVRDIHFTASGLVHVIFELHLRKPIPVDSVMSVGSTMVSGDTFVNIFRGASRENIARTRFVKQAPKLRCVDYYGIADLGGSFAKIGTALGQTVDNFVNLVGKDAKLISDIAQIQLNGKTLRECFSALGEHLEDEKKVSNDLGSQMQGLITDCERISDMMQEKFPLASQKNWAENNQDAARNIRQIKASWQAVESDVKKIGNDIESIKLKTPYSPRSVVGVVLADPQYNAAATVREIKAAYYSVVEKSLFSKVAMLVKHYFRARGIVSDFVQKTQSGNGSATELYQDWATHAHAQKENFGHIVSGK